MPPEVMMKTIQVSFLYFILFDLLLLWLLSVVRSLGIPLELVERSSQSQLFFSYCSVFGLFCLTFSGFFCFFWVSFLWFIFRYCSIVCQILYYLWALQSYIKQENNKVWGKYGKKLWENKIRSSGREKPKDLVMNNRNKDRILHRCALNVIFLSPWT